jgi:hypothetical protein
MRAFREPEDDASRTIALAGKSVRSGPPAPRRTIRNRHAALSAASPGRRIGTRTLSGFRHRALHHRNDVKADRAIARDRMKMFAAVSTPI